MQRIRDAVCPSCGTEVTVTYWPYNVPLYTVHLVRGSNRDCRQSLRPVVMDQPERDATRPSS
jgi:hypothetical protein